MRAYSACTTKAWRYIYSATTGCALLCDMVADKHACNSPPFACAPLYRCSQRAAVTAGILLILAIILFAPVKISRPCTVSFLCCLRDGRAQNLQVCAHFCDKFVPILCCTIIMLSRPSPPLPLSALLYLPVHPFYTSCAPLSLHPNDDWAFSTQLDFATPVPDAVVDAFNRVLAGDAMYDRKLHDRALAIYDQCLSSGAFEGARCLRRT